MKTLNIEQFKHLNEHAEILKEYLLTHSKLAKISNIKTQALLKNQLFKRTIGKNIEGMVEKSKIFISEVPSIFITLAENEWFFPYWHAELWDAHKAMEYIDQNNIEALNNYMIKFVKKNLSSYRAFLKTHFPTREKIFDAIFNGLENNEFILVILVIFTQIDGIVFDFSSKQFFTNKQKKSFLKKREFRKQQLFGKEWIVLLMKIK